MLLWMAVVLGWLTLALGGILLFLALTSPEGGGGARRVEAGPAGTGSAEVAAGERMLRVTALTWALVLLWIILDMLGTWVVR